MSYYNPAKDISIVSRFSEDVSRVLSLLPNALSSTYVFIKKRLKDKFHYLCAVALFFSMLLLYLIIYQRLSGIVRIETLYGHGIYPYSVDGILYYVHYLFW